MTLEGANNFSENNFSTIYTMNSSTSGQYCVVLPKVMNENVKMLVDFHLKSSFDAYGSGNIKKEELILEIDKEYENVCKKYNSCLLIFPMFDENAFQNTILSNDKQRLFDEVKRIGAITSEIYKNLIAGGIDQRNIDQKIVIVLKKKEDRQFVEWLEGQMPNFVEGLDYEESLPKEETVNPFMNPFGENTVKETPAVQETPVVSNSSIFDSVPVSPSPVVENTPVSASPVGNPSSTNDIFSNPKPVVQDSTVVSFENNNINASTTSNVSGDVGQVTSEPKPVQNVDLEGTTAFRPIADSTSGDVSSKNVENEEVIEERSGSEGIVNLMILAVVLIVITVASIELGKFLYGVYGG